jgi:hypothetical protein
MTSPKYVVLFLLCGCVTVAGPACPATTPCQDEFIVESLFSGKGTGADGVRRYQHDAGVTLFVVITQNSTNKLEAQLHEPLVGGALPRTSTTATGCALPDRIEWFNTNTSKSYEASGTFSVLDGGTSSGESVTLRFENLRWFEDGSDAGHDVEPIEATLSVSSN